MAMWVTNRERHQRFIHEELLPHWGLKHMATWFWLKVTNAGDLVSPLVSHTCIVRPCAHKLCMYKAEIVDDYGCTAYCLVQG